MASKLIKTICFYVLLTLLNCEVINKQTNKYYAQIIDTANQQTRHDAQVRLNVNREKQSPKSPSTP